MRPATTILPGDCRAILPTLEAGAYQCCVTSPPYLWQRRYLPSGHGAEALEIGREQSIGEYVETLVAVFREVRRVLADDGTLWLNIGDGYANDGKWGGRTSGKHKAALHGDTGIGRDKHSSGVAPKCLMGIPWRVAFAMIDDGWTLRSEIIWEKPNAMPSPVKDRPTTAHEHVFLFSKRPHYFFDMEAVREPYVSVERAGRPVSPASFRGQAAMKPRGRTEKAHDYGNSGRNLRTVWRIATEGSGTDHAAPMPRALARRCILAGSKLGDNVLDPFGGSGTVGRVAEDEGRGAMLIDIDARACVAAKTRTAQVGMLGCAGSAALAGGGQ